MDLIELVRTNPLPKQLAFTTAEYAERERRVRARMEEQDIDLLLVGNSGNQCWLTGYESVMPSSPTVTLLPRGGDTEVVIPNLDASCAELYSTVEHIHVENWRSGREFSEILLERILHLVPAGTARIGVELGKIDNYSSPSLDVATYLSLVTALPAATLVDTTLLIPELRLIKTAKEIAFMRRAGEFNAIGMRAAIEEVAVGRTDNDVWAAHTNAAIRAGGEVPSIDPQIVSGDRSTYMPFLTVKRNELREGDTVYLECTGVYQRYNAPLMRTAVIGTPDELTRRTADAVLGTLDAVIAAIRPGRSGDDVAREAARAYDSRPDGVYFDGSLGYSTGLGLQPTWTDYPFYLAPGVTDELRPNMTLHLPICMFSVGDRKAVGISETVLVTDDGCELITPGDQHELVIR